jgi:hypothetical protein
MRLWSSVLQRLGEYLAEPESTSGAGERASAGMTGTRLPRPRLTGSLARSA